MLKFVFCRGVPTLEKLPKGGFGEAAASFGIGDEVVGGDAAVVAKRQHPVVNPRAQWLNYIKGEAGASGAGRVEKTECGLETGLGGEAANGVAGDGVT